jgi:hypothetical protein
MGSVADAKVPGEENPHELKKIIDPVLAESWPARQADDESKVRACARRCSAALTSTPRHQEIHQPRRSAAQGRLPPVAEVHGPADGAAALPRELVDDGCFREVHRLTVWVKRLLLDEEKVKNLKSELTHDSGHSPLPRHDSGHCRS